MRKIEDGICKEEESNIEGSTIVDFFMFLQEQRDNFEGASKNCYGRSYGAKVCDEIKNLCLVQLKSGHPTPTGQLDMRRTQLSSKINVERYRSFYDGLACTACTILSCVNPVQYLLLCCFLDDPECMKMKQAVSGENTNNCCAAPYSARNNW